MKIQFQCIFVQVIIKIICASFFPYKLDILSVVPHASFESNLEAKKQYFSIVYLPTCVGRCDQCEEEQAEKGRFEQEEQFYYEIFPLTCSLLK